MTQRRLASVGVVAFVVLTAGARTVRAQDDDFILTKDGQSRLVQLDSQCAGRVLGLSREIESVSRWSNIFLVVGATLAALGSACAGTLSANTSRKVAAVIGACGAIVTILPKTLKDKDALAHTMVQADAHRTFGEKVFNQLDYLRTNGLKRKSVAYIASRFTECMAVAPSEKVPDLPSYGPDDLPAAAPSFSSMAIETPQPEDAATPSRTKAAKKRKLAATAVAAMPPHVEHVQHDVLLYDRRQREEVAPRRIFEAPQPVAIPRDVLQKK